jgi:hypothetical protein
VLRPTGSRATFARSQTHIAAVVIQLGFLKEKGTDADIVKRLEYASRVHVSATLVLALVFSDKNIT